MVAVIHMTVAGTGLGSVNRRMAAKLELSDNMSLSPEGYKDPTAEQRIRRVKFKPPDRTRAWPLVLAECARDGFGTTCSSAIDKS